MQGDFTHCLRKGLGKAMLSSIGFASLREAVPRPLRGAVLRPTRKGIEAGKGAGAEPRAAFLAAGPIWKASFPSGPYCQKTPDFRLAPLLPQWLGRDPYRVCKNELAQIAIYWPKLRKI